jgi:hypothetical protein
VGDLQVRLDIDGDVQYSRAFEVMGREADDLTAPLTESGEIVRQSVGEQFLTEGAHAGQPWQRLNRDYERWKEEEFGAGLPILVLTGDMRAAALSPNAVKVTPKRLLYEIDDDKAIWHQKGRGHNPARRMLDLTSGDRRQIDRAFARWLNHLRRGMIGTRAA